MALQTTSSFYLDTMAWFSLKSALLLIWNYGTHSCIRYIQTVPEPDCRLRKAVSAQGYCLWLPTKKDSYLVNYLWLPVGLGLGAASLRSLTPTRFLVGLPSSFPACQSSHECVSSCCVINEAIGVVGLVQDTQTVTDSTSPQSTKAVAYIRGESSCAECRQHWSHVDNKKKRMEELACFTITPSHKPTCRQSRKSRHIPVPPI